MVRGVGEAEKMLKNAKTEYFNEHEEIATYTAIETLAEQRRRQGDREAGARRSAATRSGWRSSSPGRSRS